MPDLLQIDGSFGEGGGQIIRTSVSLAAMTGRAIEIYNVRAGRTKPGLQPQHLAAVRAAAELCGARLAGDSASSVYLSFEPTQPVAAGEYSFDIGTAGAAPLVVQTVLLPLAMAGGSSTVRVSGGTHMPHSPPFEYLEQIYFPALRRAGLQATIDYSAAGFFPRGGGQIEVGIHSPAEASERLLAPLDLSERGKLENLQGFIITSNLPPHVAERGVDMVEKAMKAVGRKIAIQRRDKESIGPGAAVVLAAQCEAGFAGFSGIGELRKPMEKVAEAPCREFMRWWKSGAACDEHLADQSVLPMSFAHGKSHWTTPAVTEHLRTVLWVVQQFLPIEATIQERGDGTAEVWLENSSLAEG